MNYIFLIEIGIGILITILSIPLILEKIKPNNFYGFRTKKTLSDENIWYKANKYSGKTMLIAGIIIVISASIVYFVSLKINLFSDLFIIVIWSSIFMLPMIVMIIASFLYLKKL